MEEQNFEDSRRVKHEPPVEFVLILPRPTIGWPAVKQEKDVKPKLVPTVKLTKFDAKWKIKPKLFQSLITSQHCQLVVKPHNPACDKINPAGFVCDFCGIRFPKKWMIRKHMQKHSSERKFCCSKCCFGFKTKKALNQHSRARRINKCAVCDANFQCKLLLIRHRSESHGNVFKCDKCSYQTEIVKHFIQHKGTHIKPIACETCQKKFALKHLKPHQMQHRHGIYATAPEETFNCDKCDTSFSSSQYLRKHQKVVHDEKEVKCKVCEKICKNQDSLRRHNRIHVIVECSICHKMFSKYLMTAHVRSHSAANHFKCDLCDHSTKEKGHLKQHIERMHLLKKLVNDSKRRVDFSEFELLEKLQLKHGSSASSGEKKFKCDKCTKAFVTTQTLNWHKIAVHPNKLFECEICKKTFKTKRNMNRHRTRVHSKK